MRLTWLCLVVWAFASWRAEDVAAAVQAVVEQVVYTFELDTTLTVEEAE